MKLLFDQNLSRRLVGLLADVYPDTIHASTLGFSTTADNRIWDYARANDYIVVTKDRDFDELGAVYGFPPKVIWLRLGNCSTFDAELMLRRNYSWIADFSTDDQNRILYLL